MENFLILIILILFLIIFAIAKIAGAFLSYQRGVGFVASAAGPVHSGRASSNNIFIPLVLFAGIVVFAWVAVSGHSLTSISPLGQTTNRQTVSHAPADYHHSDTVHSTAGKESSHPTESYPAHEPLHETFYALQVSAFTHWGNAQQMYENMIQSHPDARIVTDSDYHRVLIGTFSTHDEAQHFMHQHHLNGIPVALQRNRHHENQNHHPKKQVTRI